ncbi:MAG: CHASE domain-containing protein [Elusimicrobiota bacterium]
MTPRLRWRGTLLLALAYFATARLSLLLAIPPGYATIVWPAAGVAFGALWVWGLELWPGVLIGSCAANAAMVAARGDISLSSYLLSAWIGVGSAAQAVAAAAFTRRALGGRRPLEKDKDLLVFLLLGGPLACVLSSTWSLLGMSLFRAIGPGEYLFSWSTWWIGDSIGVAVGAPLVLLWPSRRSHRGRLAVAAALAAAIAAVAGLQQYAIRDEERNARSRAALTLTDLSLTMRVGLAGYLDSVQSAADFFSSAGAVTREQFARYARGTLERHPGMQALEWRPRVPDARRRAFEETARREGVAGFRITEVEDGRVVPRGRAEEYFPILYAEPVNGNEKAFGLDINHIQPPIHDAAVRAMAGAVPVASGGVRLVQESGGQTGITVLVPVRRRPDDEPFGLVEGVFRVGDMMGTLLSGVDTRTLGVRLYDDTPPGAPQLLYERDLPSRSTFEPISMTGDFGGRRWRIELIQSADFEKHPRATLSWFALFGSLLFIYMISWVVLTLYGRGEKARING